MSQKFDGFGLSKALSYLLISSSAHSCKTSSTDIIVHIAEASFCYCCFILFKENPPDN